MKCDVCAEEMRGAHGNAKRHRGACTAAAKRRNNGAYYSRNSATLIRQERARYAADVDGRRASARERYARDPEARRAQKREYAAANPDALRTNWRRRRAVKRSATVEPFTHADLLASWDERGLYACAYCDAPYEHLDHYVPLALGGAHAVGNLVPACADCNLSKGARHPYDLLAERGLLT